MVCKGIMCEFHSAAVEKSTERQVSKKKNPLVTHFPTLDSFLSSDYDSRTGEKKFLPGLFFSPLKAGGRKKKIVRI